MATDKQPLPDSDDDIIDLTDLVEEGPGNAKAAADDSPVDMSFEQELEDLFGDAEPAPSKPAAPAEAAGAPEAPEADDDLIDLAGLGLDDEESPPAKPAAAEADDDVVDLTGLGFDEPPARPVQGAAPASADDVMDFSELGFDEAKPEPAKAAADDDLMDLAGLDFEDAAAAGPKAAAPLSEDETMADLFAAAAAAPEAAQAEETLPADESAADLADMDLGDLVPQSAAPAAADDAAMADLLGELPDEAALDIAELSDLDALHEPAPAAAPQPDAAATTAVGAAALAAVAVAGAATTATPAPTANLGSIDLGALDNLIDAAKGPPPPPEPDEATAKGRLAALGERLESLETTTATLLDKYESLSATDGDALADALSARLEDALSERLEAVLSGLPAAPDMAELKAELMAELDTRAVKDRTRLLADLAQTLDKRFDALAEGLTKPEDSDAAKALEELGQAVARLGAQAGERETAFKDFASGMETQLAELRRDLPQAGEFATQSSLTDGLEALRETLARDIAGSLDERLSELRRELRETLAGDVAASLDERLAGVSEEARKAAREEAQALGEVLSGRIEALETDRLDPDALADTIRKALLADLPDAGALKALAAKPDHKDLEALREELAASVEKTVPRVAAAVIREEIAALIKEFS